MAIPTIFVGLLLSLMGAYGYFGTGTHSVTALIPAFFGIPLLVCGVLARNDGMRKIAMHVAVTLGLIGFIGAAARAIPKLPALFAGTAEKPLAVEMQSAMALVCLIYVVMCVRSFIAARKAREAAAS